MALAPALRMRDRTGDRLRILVGGYLGFYAGAGGVTWDYIQYLLGLATLGYDVYYVEDTGLWPKYHSGGESGDCSATVDYLSSVMEVFGFGHQWAYRDEVSQAWLGPCANHVNELIRTADILLNISCSTHLRDEYEVIPVRVLIDSDPMFTQIQYDIDSGLTAGQTSIRSPLQGHTHHFTFGENVGTIECRVPTCSVTWRATRQPICLDAWFPTPLHQGNTWTTVMNWSARRPLEHQGETWGQKDLELQKLIDLPARVPRAQLAIAVAADPQSAFPAEQFRRKGWRVFDAASCVPDWQSYREFIQSSCGEFSVAKETYVKARTGWFSCRSACYLAAGRPVVTQDTGWSKNIPSGQGLLAFDDIDTAAEALQTAAAEPALQGAKARAIAEAHFDSRLVLQDLLKRLGA
jgi:hypothetical protein